MCFALASAILRAPLDVDPGAKLVLMAVADCTPTGGTKCYVGQETIAERTGIAERTVRLHLAAWERLGVIARTRRYDSMGHRTADGMDIDFPPTGRFCRLESPKPTGRKRSSLPADSAKRIYKKLSKREAIKKAKAPASERAAASTPKRKGFSMMNAEKKIHDIAPWLPLQAWRDFVAHRKAVRAPLTPGAIDLAVRKLDKLRREGHDPTDVLEQSVLCGWKGLFAVTREHPSRSRTAKRETAALSMFNPTELEHAERDITSDATRVG